MNRSVSTGSHDALEGVDIRELREAIDRSGFWLSAALLDSAICLRLGRPADWPAEHETLIQRCAAVGSALASNPGRGSSR
jgi:hypothetical protein